MNPNLLATIWSFAYILAVIGVGFILYRFTGIGSEGVRKFIHILVSGWIFILVYCYTEYRYAIIGPIAFIVINAVFVYSGCAKYLGMGNRKRDNGLIYYPLSILVMITMNYRGYLPDYGIVAPTLIMGFGDGLAALVGTSMGRHPYKSAGGKKSIEGSLTMFVVSFVVLLAVTPIDWYVAATLALVATVFEMSTPLGFDNITVPLVLAILLGAIG